MNPETTTGPKGEVANAALIAHSERFERKLHHVTDGIWSHVGAGLSNVNFVETPGGLVAIDSGECVEEAAEALAAVREHTDAPVIAVIYSHYHYVSGTSAFLEGRPIEELVIWAHEDLSSLLAEYGAETGPTSIRGLNCQFGIQLPSEGPDSMPNMGLGPFWFDPDREGNTKGHLAPTDLVSEPVVVNLGGLDFVLTPAASDSDDTIVIWVPERATCINNHIWPALFNVYPLRGEAYRDPNDRVATIDSIIDLCPEHLVGVHGPPLSGSKTVHDVLVDYRDSLQYIWDQTVRGMNRGLTIGELTEFVALPKRFQRTYFTQQFYGVVPHHVRQVHNGVRGWFDGDGATLFPVAPAVEAERIIAGFGGRDTIAAQADAALEANDPKWAIQLATWLLRVNDQDAEGRRIKAAGLRSIAQTTTSANVRGVCLTGAQELEGTISLDRYRQPLASRGRVLASPPATYVRAMRVQLDPDMAEGMHQSVQWRFADGTVASLRIRDGVAVPAGEIDDANTELTLSLEAWADLYSGRTTLADCEAAGTVTVTGDRAGLCSFFACFDLGHLAETMTIS